MGWLYLPTNSEKGPPIWGLPWVAGNVDVCGVGVGIFVAIRVGVAGMGVGVVVGTGVFAVCGVFPAGACVATGGVLVCEAVLAMAIRPTQPSTRTASTPSIIQSQVRRFGFDGGGGGPGSGPYCVGGGVRYVGCCDWLVGGCQSGLLCMIIPPCAL
jgi:hypothetical protein